MDDNDYSEDDEQDQKPNWRRQLEKDRDEAKAAAEAAKTELETLKREASFKEAGVDLSSKKGQLFAKAYDGEVTPEGIKTAYEEAFGEPKPEVSQEEIAAHQRVAATSVGSAPGAESAADKLDAIVKRIRAGDLQPGELSQVEVERVIREAGIAIGRGYETQVGGIEPLPSAK